MKRIRFLTHVMGLPGDEHVYHEGQVAEIPDALVAVIEASMTRHHAAGWIEEYDGAVVHCAGCRHDFAINDFVGHRRWYHGESLARAVAARASAQKPRGEGDIVCMECRRAFSSESALKVHEGHVHVDRKKRDRPPVARENSGRGDSAGASAPRGFAEEPAVDRPATSG